MPEREALQLIRERIAGNLEGFAGVIGASDFVKYFGEVRGEKNKRLPSDLIAAAAEQPLIYNKQFYVQHTMDAELTMAENFDEYVIKVWRASELFNRFISGNF